LTLCVLCDLCGFEKSGLNARSIPPTQPANIPRHNLRNDWVPFG
jgi:hypothetical protein